MMIPLELECDFLRTNEEEEEDRGTVLLPCDVVANMEELMSQELLLLAAARVYQHVVAYKEYTSLEDTSKEIACSSLMEDDTVDDQEGCTLKDDDFPIGTTFISTIVHHCESQKSCAVLKESRDDSSRDVTMVTTKELLVMSPQLIPTFYPGFGLIYKDDVFLVGSVSMITTTVPSFNMRCDGDTKSVQDFMKRNKLMECDWDYSPIILEGLFETFDCILKPLLSVDSLSQDSGCIHVYEWKLQMQHLLGQELQSLVLIGFECAPWYLIGQEMQSTCVIGWVVHLSDIDMYLISKSCILDIYVDRLVLYW